MRGALVLALLGCGRIAFDPLDTTGTIEPSCSDVMQNGDETGIDCGGSCAFACPGASCNTDADCVTGSCEGTCELEDLTWRPGPSLLLPRYDHACATRSDGTVFVVGGELAGNVTTGEVELLAPDASAFTTGVALILARSAHGVSFTTDDRLVAMGGVDTNSITQTTVEIYSGGASWTAGAAMPMTASSISAALAANGRLYVPDVSDTLVYDPGNNTWDLAAALGRDQYGIATDGDRVYAIAGGVAAVTRQVDAFDVATQTWTTRASAPRDRDDLAGVRAPDGRLYAIGGSDATTNGLTLVEAYTPARDAWRTMPSLAQGRSSPCATLADDGRIIAIGGATSASMPAITELYGPVMSLDVVAAEAGDTVGVTGQGFAPNAPLGVMLDDVLVATAMTNAAGDASTSFVMPARPTGIHRVTAIDQRSQYPVTRRIQIL